MTISRWKLTSSQIPSYSLALSGLRSDDGIVDKVFFWAELVDTWGHPPYSAGRGPGKEGVHTSHCQSALSPVNPTLVRNY